MQMFRGICSFGETDDFVLVSIGDAFADCPWHRLEWDVRDLINRLLQAKTNAIVLDLSLLSGASSSVITAILRIWKRVIAKGRRLVVLAPSESTRGTLDFAGLSQHLVIAKDANDALHMLGISPTAKRKRRETKLLKYVSPIAAIAAVVLLMALHLSLRPLAYQPSIVFTFITSAVIAIGGGWVAALRASGAFRGLLGLASMTGFTTLVAAVGQWSL